MRKALFVGAVALTAGVLAGCSDDTETKPAVTVMPTTTVAGSQSESGTSLAGSDDAGRMDTPDVGEMPDEDFYNEYDDIIWDEDYVIDDGVFIEVTEEEVATFTEDDIVASYEVGLDEGLRLSAVEVEESIEQVISEIDDILAELDDLESFAGS